MNDSNLPPTSRSSRALTVSLLACGLVMAAACAAGEPVEQNLEPTGSGGLAGSAGAAGKSGAAGTAGAAGTSGSAGEGGSAGSSATGGSAGASGSAGKGGSSGQAGSGGAQGTGGSSNPNCHLVLNEVQIGSSSSAADEFIEIFNPCPAAVDLTGWKLIYRAAASTNDITLLALTSLNIASQGYVVIGGSTFTGKSDDTYTAGGLAAAGGGVALHDGSGDTIDSIGYGTATNGLVEGGKAPDAPALGSSLARVPNGKDTDSNDADFQVVASPTPGAAN